MTVEYQAYLLDPNGRVTNRVDLICNNEDDAREHAKQLRNGQAVELWRGDRLIEHFAPLH